jgi:hypothetical protein
MEMQITTKKTKRVNELFVNAGAIVVIGCVCIVGGLYVRIGIGGAAVWRVVGVRKQIAEQPTAPVSEHAGGFPVFQVPRGAHTITPDDTRKLEDDE